MSDPDKCGSILVKVVALCLTVAASVYNDLERSLLPASPPEDEGKDWEACAKLRTTIGASGSEAI